MLYELALPALMLRNMARRPGRGAGPGAARGLRADRCQLRRRELAWLTAVSPRLGARLALSRIERISPELRRARKAAAAPGTPVSRGRRGRRLAHRVGPAGGARLLLLHGWNAGAEMVLPLAAALAELGFEVIVPELTGPALAPGARFDLQRVAARLARHFAPLGPYDAVIGHSAGGLVAALAARAGLPAKRLVTISSSSSLAQLLAGYLNFTGAPAALHPALPALYQARRGRNPAKVGPEDYRRFGTAHLVLHAGNDWQVAPAAAHRICAGRPGLAPRLLQGCNHRSVLSHPELAPEIARFVTAAPAHSPEAA